MKNYAMAYGYLRGAIEVVARRLREEEETEYAEILENAVKEAEQFKDNTDV